jgi:hypothetical protein
MAARLRANHQEDVRAKIQTSQLINALQNHALGKDSGEFSPTRLKAIEILLRKRLPDLSAVESTINADVTVSELSKAEREARIAELAAKAGYTG